MDYRDYQETLGVAGPLPDAVDKKEFRYRGQKNEWLGVVYSKDGVPLQIDFYIWSCSEENEKRGLAEQLEDFEGSWEVDRTWGGQGHYSATVKPAKDDEYDSGN